MTEKKRKSIKRPERGPPKMRLTLQKLRQLTVAAIIKQNSDLEAKKSREAANAEAEAKHKVARDIEKARKLLVTASKYAREAAARGQSEANVCVIDSRGIEVPAGVTEPSTLCLRGPFVHVHKALTARGFGISIVRDPDVGNSPYWYIHVRWN